MLKDLALALAAGTFLATPAMALEIRLSSPKNGTLVDSRHPVKGTIDYMPEDEKVWILIKPMGITDVWVQPFATVDGAGTFEAVPHFGRDIDIDKGTRYEFRVLADPHVKLEEGMRFSDWPEGRVRTDIFRVTRR